jgi:hypothetical protein
VSIIFGVVLLHSKEGLPHGRHSNPRKHVIKAMDDLLANTGTVVSSESEGFFSNLHAQQQNSAGKP